MKKNIPPIFNVIVDDKTGQVKGSVLNNEFLMHMKTVEGVPVSVTLTQLQKLGYAIKDEDIEYAELKGY